MIKTMGMLTLLNILLKFDYFFQLRAALYDIHDIFFTMEASERMNILRHDREVRKEKMLRQMVCYSQENVNCFKTLSSESFCF